MKKKKDRYDRIILEQKLGHHKHLNKMKEEGKDPNRLYKEWSEGIVLVNRKMITKNSENDVIVNNYEIKIVDFPLEAVIEINGIKYSYALFQAFSDEKILKINELFKIVKRENDYITLEEIKN